MTHISSGIQDIINNPDETETVTLIVTTKDTTDNALQTEIRDVGGDIEEELPFNCLAVTIPEPNIKALSDINGITEMEIESVFSGAETHADDYVGYPPGKAVEVNPTAEELFNLTTDK